MKDRGQLRAHHGDWLGKVRQLLEGVPQQDEREDLELLAHGPGKGAGQGEDEAHDLKDQHQGEGQIHGVKMVGGRVRGQCGREQSLPVQFDAYESGQEHDDEPQGETPMHAFSFPEMMQRVENIGESLEKKIHGKGLRLCGCGYRYLDAMDTTSPR